MAKHRRRRQWMVSAAAAVAVLVAAVVAPRVARDDGPSRRAAESVASRPTASPAPIPGPGIWPFTTTAEAASYPADGPFRDADTTARAFARTYLGITDMVTATETTADPEGRAVSRIVVPVGEAGRPRPDAPPVSELVLNRVGPGGPWTVVAARSPRIAMANDWDQGIFSSPMRLLGEANAYEGTLDVEVREDAMVAGQSLGRGFVTASGASDGTLGPFDAEVAFRPPSRSAGAVVLTETSAADGRPVQVTVVRVLFGRE